VTRLFLTGGSGFIGRHFIRQYADRFEAICAPQRSVSEINDGVVLRPRTDGSNASLCELLSDFKPDAVVNLAAVGVKPGDRDVDDMVRVNACLPGELFAAARMSGARGFVQAGSMAEYAFPDVPRVLMEADPLNYHNSYGASKAAATLLLSAAVTGACMGAVTLRFFGVYGPGEGPHRLTSHILREMNKGKRVPLSKGTQERDFIYIKDVLSAIYKAINYANANLGRHEVVNIGSGEAISVKRFAINFCKAGGFSPAGLNFGVQPFRETDAPYLVADIGKAKSLLNWSPQWRGSKGLEDFFAYGSVA